MKTKTVLGVTAGTATLSLLLASGYVATAGTGPAPGTVQPASSAQTEMSQPAFWHLVIRVVTTKTACENLLRVMPNSSDLKCLKAGKVYVVIPKGMGW